MLAVVDPSTGIEMCDGLHSSGATRRRRPRCLMSSGTMLLTATVPCPVAGLDDGRRTADGGTEIDASTIAKVIEFHGHMCVGLAMGIRTAEVGLSEIGAHAADEEVVAVPHLTR